MQLFLLFRTRGNSLPSPLLLECVSVRSGLQLVLASRACVIRTMMKLLVVTVVLCLTLSGGRSQLFSHISTPELAFVEQAPPQGTRTPLAHRAVLLNAQAEAQLPPTLRNPFYRDPRVGASLAKESWFAAGEQHVRERDAERIPRDKIAAILRNAGLARR